ncbi:MAG: hypothetical protein M3247_06750 [Thermoproteota archaeon]|nr:hypothetical protein [Thermoproteota archaeon]
MMFCQEHKKQPLVWIFFLVFTVVGGSASILSYFFPHSYNTPQQSRVSTQSNYQEEEIPTTMTDPYHYQQCPKPPTHAELNHYPVSYENPAEACHDFPALSARVLPDGKYPRSQQELVQGLIVHAGQAIRVRIFIDNGAAINLDPAQTIARNVSLITKVDTDSGPVHQIKIRFAGDNTNIQERVLTVITASNERLEVIPNSGQIRNWVNSESLLKGNVDIGNNVLSLGDIEPCFEHSLFIYYDLKVV